MKRLIYILTVGIVLAFTSCVNDDIWSSLEEPEYTLGSSGNIQIIGAAEEFDVKNVSTRAAGAVSDSHITEMTMFIFKEGGDLLQGYDANQQPINSAINIQKSNPTFVIETERYKGTGILASMDGDKSVMKYYDNNANDLGNCSIYIVANAWDQLTAKGLVDGDTSNGEITSLATLQDVLLDVDATLDMPKKADGSEYLGFPMIGTHGDQVKFDLGFIKSSANPNSGIATIPLKKLYSKVRFRIQVNSNQLVSGGTTPKFTFEKAEVYNVPTKVRMGYSGVDYDKSYQFTGDEDDAAQAPPTLPDEGTAIYNSTSATTSEYMEFGFYMPEHMVTPGSSFNYPSSIPQDELGTYTQYYKPNGVANQKATFVRIHGSYNDHNGQIHRVEYDIYLGQNNYNNFEVKRNQQLNNFVTITGITNHKDAYDDIAAGNISIDHRVSVEAKGYNIYMEREAILDSHFEVRPVDIELQKNAAMKIVIPREATSWIAMEADIVGRSAASGDTTYIADKGVRKYFTTNLISELNSSNHKFGTDKKTSYTRDNGYSYSITTGLTEEDDNYLLIYPEGGGNDESTEYHRIWFYIDENPNVYDKTGSGLQTTEPGYGLVETDEGYYTVSTTQYRKTTVKFLYDADDEVYEDTHFDINFQQWNLWRVWNQSGTRFYDIEHEEEYLNNYASDQGYGQTKDGMPFGLDGIQLSNLYDAAYLNYKTSGLQSFMQIIANLIGVNLSYKSLVNQVFAAKSIKYDFYLPRDVANFDMPEEDKKNLKARSYAGLTFNQEIATWLLNQYASHQQEGNDNTHQTAHTAKINKIWLNESPRSAFAYVYNKNKRNANGEVATQKWYLPAIDEIEEIAQGAYDQFNGVFQDKYYWSCQPAFNPVFIDLDTSYRFITWNDTDNTTGEYYYDNISRARATSVKTKADGTFDALVSSGSEVFRTETGYLRVPTIGTPQVGYYTATDTNPPIDHNPSYDNHPGNQLRTEVNRIRAVYRSGTKPTTTE